MKKAICITVLFLFPLLGIAQNQENHSPANYLENVLLLESFLDNVKVLDSLQFKDFIESYLEMNSYQILLEEKTIYDKYDDTKSQTKYISNETLDKVFGNQIAENIVDVFLPKLESFYKKNKVNITRTYFSIIGEEITISSPHNFEGLAFNDKFGKTKEIENKMGEYGFYGIDVSKHQGSSINWKDVINDTIPEPFKFIILRSNIGKHDKDPYYKRNREALEKYDNINVGVYHAYWQTSKNPKKQAENYIKTVKLSNNNLRPILDIEGFCRKKDDGSKDCRDLWIPHEELISHLKIYIKEIEEHYKVPIIIYTSKFFYERQLKGHIDIQKRDLWLARYTESKEGNIKLPFSSKTNFYDYSKTIGWQYSRTGVVDGINTFCTNEKTSVCVDLNFFFDKDYDKWLIKNHNIKK